MSSYKRITEVKEAKPTNRNLPVEKSNLRPFSSSVVLSGVTLSLNNCVLRVFVGVFERLVLFLVQREELILLVLENTNPHIALAPRKRVYISDEGLDGV